jgi:signal transduction histidine kinase
MTDRPRVLVVDDQHGARITLQCILDDAGYATDVAGSAQDALQMAAGQPLDAALIDISLPDMAGLELLGRLKELHPDCVVIVVTGHASMESAVAALNQGAAGYAVKPIDPDQLILQLEDAVQKQSLTAENRRMVRTLSLLHRIGTALSQSLDMRATLGEALRIVLEGLGAPAGAIWVAGQNGGGWELLVQSGLPPEAIWDGAAPATTDGTPLSAVRVGDGLRIASNGARHDLDLVGVPLRHAAEVKGLMGLCGTASDGPNGRDVELLEAIGGHMGVAIQNMQLYRELQHAHRELQQAQARLVQSEKLSALGQLISGVAHELNNPLAVVIGFAHHLTRTDCDEAIRHPCERIYEQAKRCSRILDQLLTFAREYAPEWALVDVNRLIRESLELFAYKLRVRGIAVDLQLDPNLPATGADPHKLQQVFVNIIGNAYQSLDDAGQDGTLSIRTSASDGAVRIVFADDGPGILPENLDHVFDPFFTTKELGKGTGLGLSVSYGIIAEHGGDISVASEFGHGATFTITFPIRAAPEPDLQLPPDADISCCRDRRVLVVDDEESVADLVTRLLTAFGGRVDVAPDGVIGKEKALSGHYDLVIADVKMPKMDGQRFYEQLLAENPEVARRVVFCTGDTVDESTREFVANSGRPFLAKPFAVETLASVVRQALQG